MSIFASVLTGGSNNHQTTAEEVNALATDFVSEGVVGAITNTGGVAPATGGFAVNAQGSPAMAVDVSAGIAYVTATPTGGSSQTLRVKSTATEEVTIAANSTGSTRYDWIYIKIDPDKAANPAADGSDVATLVTSRSTSSSSDDGTPPTYGYPIAVVTVANGASSITNGNIADKRISTGAVPADGSLTPAKLDSDAFRDDSGDWKISTRTDGRKEYYRERSITTPSLASGTSGNITLFTAPAGVNPYTALWKSLTIYDGTGNTTPQALTYRLQPQNANGGDIIVRFTNPYSSTTGGATFRAAVLLIV